MSDLPVVVQHVSITKCLQFTYSHFICFSIIIQFHFFLQLLFDTDFSTMNFKIFESNYLCSAHSLKPYSTRNRVHHVGYPTPGNRKHEIDMTNTKPKLALGLALGPQGFTKFVVLEVLRIDNCDFRLISFRFTFFPPYFIKT